MAGSTGAKEALFIVSSETASCLSGWKNVRTLLHRNRAIRNPRGSQRPAQ